MTRRIRTYALVALLALSTPLRVSGQTPVPPTLSGGDQARPQDPPSALYAETLTTGRVFIAGEIRKGGSYALKNTMTVSELIALAGGLSDYAKGDKITIVRFESGKYTVFHFNYSEESSERRLKQNIELKPGDTVVVP
jgi:polysaccharide export outer membrane protein